MNVLLLNNEFHPIGGGGATVTRYVGGYLAAQGHDVRLVTSSFHDLPREEAGGGCRESKGKILYFFRRGPDADRSVVCYRTL